VKSLACDGEKLICWRDHLRGGRDLLTRALGSQKTKTRASRREFPLACPRLCVELKNPPMRVQPEPLKTPIGIPLKTKAYRSRRIISEKGHCEPPCQRAGLQRKLIGILSGHNARHFVAQFARELLFEWHRLSLDIQHMRNLEI